jgi:hypothetical protein
MFGVTTAFAAELYFDANGTDPGFGIATTNEFTVDFTAPTWTSDTNGIASHTTVSTNDFLHFGLEGTGGNWFNLINYSGIPVSGIRTYQTTGSTAWIVRFQKAGGGFEQLEWAPGAVFQTDQNCSLFYNFGTVGDFVKTGTNWMAFADGNPKVDGKLTISNSFVVIRHTDTVNADSDFHMVNGGLRVSDLIDEDGPTTLTLGTLGGSGVLTKDGNSNALNNLTIYTEGFDMANGSAGETITLGWGAGATLSETSSSTLEISKAGGTTYADLANVQWASSTMTLGGDLELVLLPESDSLAAGDSFKLFGTTLAGAFEHITLPDAGPGLIFDLTLLSSSGTVTVAVGDTNAPATPTGLTAAGGVYTVALDWNDNGESDLGGYNIYRAENGTDSFTKIASTTASEYTDITTDPNDNTYHYKVSAYDLQLTESGISTDSSATLAFALGNGDFESPEGNVRIDASGHWVQNGDQQSIQRAGWTAADGAQGVWLKGWNTTVTNSFHQDRDAVPGLIYELSARFKIQPGFRANGGELEMALVWLDSGGSELSRESLDVLDTIAVDDTFTDSGISATAPLGAATVQCLFSWTTTSNANDGSAGKSAMVDTVILTRSGNLYDAWALSYGLTNGMAAGDYDVEPDGMDNLLEYALGGNPTNNDAAAVLPVSSSDGNWFYHIHQERTDDSALSYTVKLKDDLVNDPSWDTNGVVFFGESDVADDFKSVTNRTDIGNNEYLRLEVEKN